MICVILSSNEIHDGVVCSVGFVSGSAIVRMVLMTMSTHDEGLTSRCIWNNVVFLVVSLNRLYLPIRQGQCQSECMLAS